jgi:predicted nuclease with TOPRIM domain
MLREKLDEVEGIEGEVADLRSQVDDLDEVKEELDDLQGEHGDLQDERDELASDRDRLKEELEEATKKIAALEDASQKLDTAAAAQASDDALTSLSLARADLVLVKAALRDLVDGFEATKIGRVSRVGALVVVAPGGSVAEAPALGALVARARALLAPGGGWGSCGDGAAAP